MAEQNQPAQGRRTPVRPPWLVSQDVQRRVSARPWRQQDEPDAHTHPYPPTGTAQHNDPRPAEELPADPAAPDYQQRPAGHTPRDEFSGIGPPHNPGQPVDSVLEAPNSSRLSNGGGGHERADLDTGVADDVRDTVQQQPSAAGPWNEQASPVTTNGVPGTAEPQQPAARGMAAPPAWVPGAQFPETPHSREPAAEQPAATPAPDATPESFPHTPGFAPSGAPPPPPPPPPGWPPGAPLPPPWWPPPGAPPWPPVPLPPPPDWQQHWANDAGPPPTAMPPDVGPVQTFRMPPSLDEATVVDRRKSAPQSGWRRAMHRATRGHINPGDSRKDRAQGDLLAQIRLPLAGDFRIAVLSVKGGVGKTTTTLGLGSALALVRRDRVIAVDANPDRGTLAERVYDNSAKSTVRDLLSDAEVDRYADIRRHTRMSVSRLEVLASEEDPGAANVFDELDYRRTVDILGRYYNVILTDCGTGIMHSAMAGVLDLAHSVVLVSSPAIDAIDSASATLDWLMQHGRSSLVREGHVVLSASRPGSVKLKLDKVYEFFEARCRSIHFVPFDPHLAQGADVDFGMLKPATRQAYLGLAGAVAQNFPRVQAYPAQA